YSAPPLCLERRLSLSQTHWERIPHLISSPALLSIDWVYVLGSDVQRYGYCCAFAGLAIFYYAASSTRLAKLRLYLRTGIHLELLAIGSALCVPLVSASWVPRLFTGSAVSLTSIAVPSWLAGYACVVSAGVVFAVAARHPSPQPLKGRTVPLESQALL